MPGILKQGTQILALWWRGKRIKWKGGFSQPSVNNIILFLLCHVDMCLLVFQRTQLYISWPETKENYLASSSQLKPRQNCYESKLLSHLMNQSLWPGDRKLWASLRHWAISVIEAGIELLTKRHRVKRVGRCYFQQITDLCLNTAVSKIQCLLKARVFP